MSTKTEIVVRRASYSKVFPAIFRRVSFSTATGPCTQNQPKRDHFSIASVRDGPMSTKYSVAPSFSVAPK
jgi:hypothetical protein